MKRIALVLLVTTILSAQSAPEVEITAEPHHHLIFTNDQVRVFSVELAPQAHTLMHWHRHDYVYVQIGASEVINAVKGKDPVTIKLQDGQTGFMSASFAHVARNTSGTTFRNVTVELLQDDKLRRSPSHWEEERGLDILQGGTKEILWVKDGIRASEIELQPRGVIPQHHHAGAHIAIALTDCELRSDVVGKGTSTVTFKAGEAHWISGGFTHTLTNTGHSLAKIVTLEVP
jgi:quercetin dioxygenase-like cupin family protein